MVHPGLHGVHVCLVLACLGGCGADAPWVDIFKSDGRGGGNDKNITSMWGPSLVVTKDNTTIACE